MASSIETTYFEKLAELLSQAGHSVRVTVLATGGWVSYDELTALNAIGLEPILATRQAYLGQTVTSPN